MYKNNVCKFLYTRSVRNMQIFHSGLQNFIICVLFDSLSALCVAVPFAVRISVTNNISGFRAGLSTFGDGAEFYFNVDAGCPLPYILVTLVYMYVLSVCQYTVVRR